MVQGIVLFSGYNPRAIIAFLRTCRALGFTEFAIIAQNKEDFILRTAYRDAVIYTRQHKSLEQNELYEAALMLRNSRGWDSFVVLPSTEFLNRYCIQNREALSAMGYRIPLSELSLYAMISDKARFGMLCRKHGIVVPAEIPLPTCYSGSFVAKPKSYMDEKSGHIYAPVLVQSEADYAAFCTQMPSDAFYFQEFIQGESLYLLFYFSENGMVYKLSQRNLMQQPNGKSILAACLSDVHNSIVADAYISLFQKLRYCGFVMVELRKRGDTYYMIEANPRLWGPSQLFVDAGYNFFTFFLHDHGFLPALPRIPFYKDARYYWHGGLLETTRLGKSPVFFEDFAQRYPVEMAQWIQSDIYRREDTISVWEGTI